MKNGRHTEKEKCPRCGLRVSGAVEYCPACGQELERSKKTPPKSPQFDLDSLPPLPEPSPRSPFPNSSNKNRSSNTPLPAPTQKGETSPNTLPKRDSDFNIQSIFGWRTITGTVIAVEPPYMTKPQYNWVGALLKLSIGLMLLPFLLGMALFAFAWSIWWSIFFPRRGGSGGGFGSNMASQLLSYFLMGKLFGHKDMVPVRDVRLRGPDGNEHLIRIQGDLVTGNVNVGDVIQVQGPSRGGTIFLRRGFNQRTNSVISAKIR